MPTNTRTKHLSKKQKSETEYLEKDSSRYMGRGVLRKLTKSKKIYISGKLLLL